MITMFVKGTVPDFDAWKKVVDDFGPTYKAFGVVRSTYYCGIENPNELTVAHEFETIEAARKYAESSELREGRSKAGVSAPTVWFAAEFYVALAALSFRAIPLLPKLEYRGPVHRS